jgi:hypothetical protein
MLMPSPLNENGHRRRGELFFKPPRAQKAAHSTRQKEKYFYFNSTQQKLKHSSLLISPLCETSFS